MTSRVSSYSSTKSLFFIFLIFFHSLLVLANIIASATVFIWFLLSDPLVFWLF